MISGDFHENIVLETTFIVLNVFSLPLLLSKAYHDLISDYIVTIFVTNIISNYAK